MAATTVQAFNEFKEKLRLTDAQKDLVKGRRSSAASYLGDAFPTTSDLPRVIVLNGLGRKGHDNTTAR